MKILAVVLARGGSTRLPRKNLAVLGNKTLVEHAILAAKDDDCDLVVVSSDDPEIGAIGILAGATWVMRPDSMSGPDADISDALKHALETAEAENGCQYELVAGLQAAIPIRPRGCIRQLCEHVWTNKSNGGLTMIRRKPWIWQAEDGRMSTWFDPSKYPRSQDVTKTFYEEINAVQVAPRGIVLDGNRWNWPLSVLVLPIWADVDVDTADDLAEADNRFGFIQEALCSDIRMSIELFRGPN